MLFSRSAFSMYVFWILGIIVTHVGGTLQATSSSFDLILSPTVNQKNLKVKKETMHLVVNSIISTVLASGSKASPYTADMTGTVEHAEWVLPEYVKFRFYIVATIDESTVDRSGASTFDLRDELDNFILDNFFGDVFLSTILSESHDEILQVATTVMLQVSENQSRIYQQRSPSSSVLLGATFGVLALFVVVYVEYMLTHDEAPCSNMPPLEEDLVKPEKLEEDSYKTEKSDEVPNSLGELV